MAVLFGSHYVGKTERVPRTLWVSTRFLHVMFFPFVPRSSWLFIHAGTRVDLGIETEAFPIPLQPRSLLLAWLRAVFGAALLVTALVSVTKYMLDRPFGDQLVAAIVTLIPLAGLVATYVLDRPSPARVRALLTAAGAPETLVTRAMQKLSVASG